MNPIVLAHGFFGFAEMAGLQYFKGVESFLKKRFPDLEIHITEVAPNDFIEVRAKQLWQQIERIEDEVHIIGHSMGGLDARFLISPEGLDRSEKVISLTTIATPHWGSPVADSILDKTEIFSFDVIEPILNKLSVVDRQVKKIVRKLKKQGELGSYLSEYFRFTSKGMINLTTDFLKVFNQKYSDAAGVDYFSYSGVSGPGEKDRLPPLLYIPWAIIFHTSDEKAGGRNDAMVSVDSAKWGEYKGELPADHFKQVGYDLSGLSWFKKVFPCLKSFNHLAFYKKLVKDLNK